MSPPAESADPAASDRALTWARRAGLLYWLLSFAPALLVYAFMFLGLVDPSWTLLWKNGVLIASWDALAYLWIGTLIAPLAIYAAFAAAFLYLVLGLRTGRAAWAVAYLGLFAVDRVLSLTLAAEYGAIIMIKEIVVTVVFGYLAWRGARFVLAKAPAQG